MNFKSLSFTLLLSLVSTGLFAHAYWLKTSSKGTLNKKQEITLTFAEPTGAAEPIDGEEWAGMKGYNLWLISPSNKKVKLDAVVSGKDAYKASFTPDEKGTYHVFLENESLDVNGEWRVVFYADALVQIGNEAIEIPAASQDKMSLVAVTNKGGEVALKLDAGTIGVAAMKLTAFDEKGNKEDISLNADGTALFKPAAKGAYKFEAVHLNKEAQGTYNGAAFKNLYYAITTSVDVK